MVALDFEALGTGALYFIFAPDAVAKNYFFVEKLCIKLA